MIDKAQKSVLVLGNGPSLRNLNYAALPIDVDIFRVNQFYFEDFYFAGKEVDLVLTAANFSVHEKFFTLQNLVDRDEYKIAKFIFQESNSGLEDLFEIERFYPSVLRLSNILLTDEELLWWGDFVYRQYNSYGQGPTNGVNLIPLALSMGYNKIYVGGIDLYCGFDSSKYGFSIYNKKNFNQIIPKKQINYLGYDPWHSMSIDIFVIEKCLQIAIKRGGFIYNVGLDSYLSNIIPEAPILNSQPILSNKAKVMEIKKPDYINDIMFMPKLYINKFKQPANLSNPALFNELISLIKDIVALLKKSYLLTIAIFTIFVSFVKKLIIKFCDFIKRLNPILIYIYIYKQECSIIKHIFLNIRIIYFH